MTGFSRIFLKTWQMKNSNTGTEPPHLRLVSALVWGSLLRVPKRRLEEVERGHRLGLVGAEVREPRELVGGLCPRIL
ncbi:hypothetical protein PR202_gb16970 [Eleusine coracana subsp. coracana]|uniref:Uncharacterized protein n=1 Tax=Eleusine coracana subsp. coracana TaxID=191504 RepID=A0AAV5F1R4_ELECO|nr:hypothetical protein PR202_gb16970 [Eleusine coracana subsp. coracana]